MAELDAGRYDQSMTWQLVPSMGWATRDRHTFGGLTDQAFRMIPLLESGRNAAWPF
jgi:hypothetical protein